MDKTFQTNTSTESVSLPTESGLLPEKAAYYMKKLFVIMYQQFLGNL